MNLGDKKKELIKHSQELEHELFKLATSPETEIATRMQIAAKLVVIYQRLLTIEAIEEGKEGIDELGKALPTADDLLESAASLLDKGSQLFADLSGKIRGKGKES